MTGPEVFHALGGAPGCREFARSFYSHVARDPLLRPLFPNSFHCAIEEFAAFLVQFLGGPAEHSQRRWWLSLRESHARFRIGPPERDAWLNRMNQTIDELSVDDRTQAALRSLFEASSAYVIGQPSGSGGELAESWAAQTALDEAVAAIDAGDLPLASALAGQCSHTVLPGLLARMIRRGHQPEWDYAALVNLRYAGRTLLHEAAAAGNLPTVELLLASGADPNAQDGGKHTPLYSAANECAMPVSGEVIRVLVRAGAKVDAADGVQRCTPLHMAARRGNVSAAKALLECGANPKARDKRGDTPLQRALNCRKPEVAAILR
jgi:hemoglobin